jgi:hypothetical protein
MHESMQNESSNKMARRLLYGPEVLRLIESPEFRAYFDKGGRPSTSTTEHSQEAAPTNRAYADLAPERGCVQSRGSAGWR